MPIALRPLFRLPSWMRAFCIETKADLCAVFPVLPRYPVTLKIWFADEEFPVSGKLFLQDHADHYLSVEDAVTVGEILLQKLSEAFSSL